ncbi:putative PDDEXK endonuclease [Nocardia sp. NPDC055165]
MSESSDKGRDLEKFIAKTLQKKLGARVSRDGKSGAGSHQKMDLVDYFQDTPFDIEAKNHKTIAIKQWMRQAKAGASLSRIPTVVFTADDDAGKPDVLACVPFTDLVDLAVQIRDLRRELADLRTPVALPVDEAVDKAVAVRQATGGVSFCRNGHIVSPGSNKCLDKKCPYSSTHKRSKEKK